MWSNARAETFRAVTAVLIAVVVSIASWQIVGKPNAERNERQTIALSQQTEIQTNLSWLFDRPKLRKKLGEAKYLTALQLWREGRRFSTDGDYREAIVRFDRASALLELCRGCPTAGPPPR
jgi:hypothetical protein